MATKANEAPEAVQNATEGKATKKSREYKLRSGNKYLTVGSLGVQFINGLYVTHDADEAKALLTIDDISLDEG